MSKVETSTGRDDGVLISKKGVGWKKSLNLNSGASYWDKRRMLNVKCRMQNAKPYEL